MPVQSALCAVSMRTPCTRGYGAASILPSRLLGRRLLRQRSSKQPAPRGHTRPSTTAAWSRTPSSTSLSQQKGRHRFCTWGKQWSTRTPSNSASRSVSTAHATSIRSEIFDGRLRALRPSTLKARSPREPKALSLRTGYSPRNQGSTLLWPSRHRSSLVSARSSQTVPTLCATGTRPSPAVNSRRRTGTSPDTPAASRTLSGSSQLAE